ncbi:MAG: GDP-mannose 4,6-dehydratase [Verrucomicrobiota bacterium]
MKKPAAQAPKTSRASSVLVTGGAGFIGSHLVERLLADGHSVTVIDDLSTGSLANLHSVRRHPALRVIVSKVSNCAQLKRVVSSADAVYHLAAAVGVEWVLQNPIRTLETNLHETEVLLKAAAARRTPVLLTSSSEVYGKSSRPVLRETQDLLIGPPDHRRWGYACSKLVDEFLGLAYHQERNVPVVVARLFNTVGPRQTGRFGMVLPRFVADARAGRPLKVFGNGSQTRCFCYVADTIESLVRLQNHPGAAGQVFNVGTTEQISILQLARTVIDVLQSRSRIQLVPYDRAYRTGFEDMRQRKPSVAKLAALTGFRPQTRLREIIRLTATQQ